MHIAIFDYYVEARNPIGGCHRKLLEDIYDEHEITVFAVRFDNPAPDRIRWVRVPAPRRPLALLFVAYHLLAPLSWFRYRLRPDRRVDLVQEVESNLSFGDVAYSHFCHRAYLRTSGSPKPIGSLRSFLRWLDHRLHAAMEPLIYRKARRIVVPSQGLARELKAEYGLVDGRVTIIPNPVDVERFRPPPAEDKRAARRDLGLSDDDVVFVFVALGHFERKGLLLLLEALRTIGDERARLLVVGGEPDLVNKYRKKVDALTLGDRVRFVGMQTDVRPFLHASDVFVLPSAYEAFPLVALEAAAAGLPLLVTPLHGVEEYIRPGQNGLVVARESEAVAEGLAKFLAMTPSERESLGQAARQDAAPYSREAFADAWRSVYAELASSDSRNALT